MKKIISPHIQEVSKYYCDKHTDVECHSELKIESWYGSDFDTNSLEVHLCDECLKEMYSFIKEKYNILPEQDLI